MEIKVQRPSLWMINTVFLLLPINNHQTNTIKLIPKFHVCFLLA
ncbi:protein YmgL, partial [Escherichia coli]